MISEYKGIDIHYEKSGSGEALVLLHGFLETMEMWKDLVAEFKTTHTVLSMDLPGHGSTGSLGYVHSMERMAEVVIHVMEQEGITEARFIGHSMGGYVALALACMRPDLVNGLCLMNSTFEADSDERRELRERAIAMAKTNYKNLVRMSFTNLFAPVSRISYKKDFETAMAIALKTPVQGYIAAQAGMQKREDHLETFLSARGPKAMVIGKQDGLVDAEQLKNKLAITEVEICELSGGHMSHIENMYDLSVFLLRFI